MIVFFKYGYSKISRVFIALLWVLSLTWVFFCSPSYAQTFFSQPRLFEVEQACEAVSSIRRQTSPVTIDSGEVLTVFGENKIPGGTHAFIRIDGQQKWFPLRCGRYDGIEPPPPPPLTNFKPFFDNEDNPVPTRNGLADATPPPPVLDDFDKAVNEVCGLPGKVVSRIEFATLMNDFPDVLSDVQAFTGNRVFGNEPPITNSELYLGDFRESFSHRGESVGLKTFKKEKEQKVSGHWYITFEFHSLLV